MKKVLSVILLTAALGFSALYNSQIIRSITAFQREGVILEADSNKTSLPLNIRGMSRIQLTISGIDSATVIVSALVGGTDYLTPDGKIGVLDTAKVEFNIDTLTTNGLHDLSTYMGTALKVRTTKKDNAVKVRFNLSTY